MQGDTYKAGETLLPADVFSEKMMAGILLALKNHFEKAYLAPLNRIG